MGKMESVPANGGTSRAAIGKSEDETYGTALSKSEEEVKDLKAQVELLVKAVDLVIGKPMRKAVTTVNFVPRTNDTQAEPTKAEIDARLNEVIRGGKLTKSQSERVLSFSMGNCGYEQIKDLLEKK
jgi:hypothetical protein